MTTELPYRRKNLNVSFGNGRNHGQASTNNTNSAYVRYASETQEPILRHISAPIPEEAQFASPIYYLNNSEVEYLDEKRATNPYAVKEDNNVAKQLQDNAEIEGRVRYPIYVESDAEVGLDTQVQWLKKFCRDKLNVDPNSCNWFYSGHRSIHAHVPKLATETTIETIKNLSEQFEHEIDSKIYSRKRQFRLPGAKHDKTPFSKIPIQPEWEHDRIIREATQTEPEQPQSFRGVLTDTFGSGVVEQPEKHLWHPETDCENHVDPGLNDWERHSNSMPEDTFTKWKAHYGSVVSPYANSGNGKRSLLVAEVFDGAFGEKRESHYEHKEEQIDTILPCDVWGFWGCDRDYTTSVDHRPVKISGKDYQKIVDLDIRPGDKIAMIAGQSRSSRISKLSEFEFSAIKGVEEFKDAIETLEYFNYDIGGSNLVEGSNPFKKSETGDSPTEAYELQKRAERDGIETLSHDEKLIVLLRQLSINGIEATREWFKKQYGADYDSELTNQHIESACDRFEWLPDYTTTSSNVTRCSI